MFLSKIVELSKKVISGIKNKVPLVNLLMDAFLMLPEIVKDISNMIKSKGSTTIEEKKLLIDDALLAFDASTGEEGFRIIKDIAVGKEEEALDHFKEFLRCILYAQYGIN